MKNKYNRKSKKVFKVKCKACKKSHDILESYAYYFVEFKKTNPHAVLTCPNCGVSNIHL